MTTETVRSFDAVLDEMKKMIAAGIYPLPSELALEAVEAQARYVKGKTRDFTMPTLEQTPIYVVSGQKPHTLAELPWTMRPNVRGLFGTVRELTVRPNFRGGPMEEDCIADDYIIGRVYLAGYVTPPAPISIFPTPYRVYEIGFEQRRNGEVFLRGVRKVGSFDTAAELVAAWPAITPMFLLETMANGFARITERHEELAKSARGVYINMLGQCCHLGDLLSYKPLNANATVA